MNEKLNKMVEWTQSKTVIKLNTEKFVNYVKLVQHCFFLK